jgi:tRNA nucleotidyltransferase (CCA-adding enzyme)
MKIYLVGGAVRDQLLGLPIKERDWVVVGATEEDMLRQGYRQVGKEFPVFLHPKTGEEYALARTEHKMAPGYTGFAFDTSPDVSLAEDLVRRDLTINAMAQDSTGRLIDHYQGQQDVEKILRHVSPAFAEDPVRILRVGRFLARYSHRGFKIAAETIALMQAMVASGEVDALVAERVWKELVRALGEPNPEQFFAVLSLCDALPILFPTLAEFSLPALLAGPRIKALEAAAQLSRDTTVRFAALFSAPHTDDARENIQRLCNRYRTPNSYRDLASLTALHYPKILSAKTFSAETLVGLFYTLDVFRREPRFYSLLLTCQAIATTENISVDIAWLKEAAQITKSVPIQPLIDQGLTDAHLANALKKERVAKINLWLAEPYSRRPGI